MSAVMEMLLSNRQKDENYRAVVAVLNTGWRVIKCKEGIQWILQRRDHASNPLATGRWRGRTYHRDRNSLLRRVASLCGPVNDGAMAMLVALPDWIHLQSQGGVL